MTKSLQNINEFIDSLSVIPLDPDVYDYVAPKIHPAFLESEQGSIMFREIELEYSCWEYANYGRNVRSSGNDILTVAEHATHRGENLTVKVSFEIDLGSVHSYPELTEEIKTKQEAEKQEKIRRIDNGIEKLKQERENLLNS